MRLGLTFTQDGMILGEGIDDVARFVIDGTFIPATNEASWTKSYVRLHSVQYAGLYDGRSICGSWTLSGLTGGFWIWPSTLEQSEEKTATLELQQPEPVLLKS